MVGVARAMLLVKSMCILELITWTYKLHPFFTLALLGG